MPAVFHRKIVKVGGSFRITIPLELIEGLGLKQGDILDISSNDDAIIMRKKT